MRPTPETPQEQQLRDVTRQWAPALFHLLFGDAGPNHNTDLRTMERFGALAAQGVIQGLLEFFLHHQNQQLAEHVPCPTCQRSCTPQLVIRTLAAHGADLQHNEPVAHCPVCRRDFFPPTDGSRT